MLIVRNDDGGQEGEIIGGKDHDDKNMRSNDDEEILSPVTSLSGELSADSTAGRKFFPRKRMSSDYDNQSRIPPNQPEMKNIPSNRSYFFLSHKKYWIHMLQFCILGQAIDTKSSLSLRTKISFQKL